VTKNLGLDKKGKCKKLDQSTDLHKWQRAHIEKGVESAKKGDFASVREVDGFFRKYGSRSG